MRKLKIRICALVFFVAPIAISVFAQDKRIVDSLNRKLATSKNASDNAVILSDLSEQYINSDLQKARQLGQAAYDLAMTVSDNQARIYSALQLAKVYYFMSDLGKAMDYATKAMYLAESDGNMLMLAQSLDAIGSIYYDIGNKVKSSEFFYRSLGIYEKLENKPGLGGTYCRIGTLYFEQKDFEKAIEFYQRSIDLARQIRSETGIASNLNNLAKVYTEQGSYAKALDTYKQALEINLKEANTFLIANNYLNISDVYTRMKNFQAALTSVQKAQLIFEKMGNKPRIAKCRITLAEIYRQMNDPEKSREIYLETLRSARNDGFNEIAATSAGMLQNLYLAKKDSANAYKYFMIQQQFQDSIAFNEKQKTLAKLELQYQFEKNEQNLKLTRQRKNVVIFVVSGALFFAIVIMILVWNQLRLKNKKQQLEKESLEKEVEFKNKEMVLNVMSLMKKNEILADISEKLIKLEEEAPSTESRYTIQRVASEIRKGQEEEIWKEFSIRFKEVHGDFYDKLLHQFPSLTPNELKLCAFLRLNMTSKDIAELTGQRISSLETARYRLRLKLGIVNSDVNLITFLAAM